MFIYAQRPEATACASYDMWNKRMGRVVRRGCKGIALPDAGENSRGLRYVFDIEDTVSRNGSRRPYVWEYLDEHEEPVTRILAEKYGITDEGGLAYQVQLFLSLGLTLANEKYCGDLKQKKTITPDYLSHQKKYNHGEEEFVFLKDHHEPIIDRALWEEAQREIARRDIDGKYGTGHGNRYPLSGKIKCSECGQSFVSRGRKRKDGSRYKAWRCGTTTNEGKRRTDPAGNEIGCDMGYQLRDEVGMEMVRQSVGMLKINTDSVISNITQIVIEAIQASQDNSQVNAEKLKKELTQIEEKKKSMLDAFFARSISKDDMKLMNAEYDRRISELTDKIGLAEKRESLSYDTQTLSKDIHAKVTSVVSGETATDHFYGNLLDHITAYPDRRMEVHLKLLPTKWTYVLESLTDIKKRTESC